MADFTCPFCNATSHNPNDAAPRYCGQCHIFVDDEATAYKAILHERIKPHAAAYKAGADARDAGRGFHEGPRPDGTVQALSWRIGWNDRALWIEDNAPKNPPGT